MSNLGCLTLTLTLTEHPDEDKVVNPNPNPNANLNPNPNPNPDKYRRIRCSNPAFVKHLDRFEASRACLTTVGFREETTADGRARGRERR